MEFATQTVGEFLFGSGSIAELGGLLSTRRQGNGVVFLIDHFFDGHPLVDRLPIEPTDLCCFVDSTHEPTTDGVDACIADIMTRGNGEWDAVVGIGGGCVLDTAKAVSNLLGNGGQAADFQGWDLLEKPGVFKVGVPTLSGTGAEASRTCVMMNYEKNLKLGMNSKFTIFDRLVLDPELTASVPREQYFFTGMDTYIHCIESLNGRYRHPLADACSREALNLCREVFLSDDMMSPENREKLMVASYLGGSAIGNSFVGLVHPLSAGLSMVMGLHHCEANCIVMNQMHEFYPEETAEFKKMVLAQGIHLRSRLCEGIDDSQFQALHGASIIHEKPLANALGDDFVTVLTTKKTRQLFGYM